ncbi:MAG: hypothetical protein Crog4KO_22640 [Crocinitomicaceae bacterium]
MKNFTKSLIALVVGIFSVFSLNAQTLNQNASWPNLAWTLTGTYDVPSLIADPTVDPNFSYDDDAAGSGSTDILIATSPVIDLTAASIAGETNIFVDYDYNYNFGGTFDLEWYDADATSWVTWEAIADNSGTTANWCANLAGVVTSMELDISGFTATQLTGFQYRLNYDASSVYGWGFCFAAPTIYSVAPPSCLDPSALASSNVLATSADITWTAGNASQLAWEVSVVDAGMPAMGGTPSATTTFNATGLTANTTYDAYVREICAVGDTTAWVGPISFTTPCATIAPAYLTDFATFLPSCWDEATNGDLVTGPTGLGAGSWGQSGTLARINLYTTGTSDWLVSPFFDLSSGGWELVVEGSGQDFGAGVGTFSGMGSDDSVQVVLSTDGGATWTSIYTFDVNNQPAANATDYIIDLSAYTGTNNQFGILATEGAANDPEDYYMNIHSFEIRQPLTCSDPTLLNVTNIAATTADVNWTAGNVSQLGWEVSIVPNGNAPIGGTASATTTFNATGLTDNTDYDVYVREICSVGDTTAWLGPISFTTPCAAFIPDYAQDFTIYTPQCWEERTGLLTSSSALSIGSSQWTSDGFANNGSSGAARINIWTTNQQEWLVSPSIDLTGGPFQLEYDVALTTFSGTGATTMDPDDSLAVVISTDNGATWSNTNLLQVYTDGSEPSNVGQREYIDLSAYSGLVRFGFYGKSTQNLAVDNNAYIDNFLVTSLCLPTSGTDVQTACDTFTWIDGNTYTASNNTAMFTIVGGNAAGCDSIVTLDLTINNSATSTDVQTACDSLVWNGTTYTTTGMYTWVGTTTEGCDSTVTLDLTVNNSATSTDVQTACDSLVWNGTTYTATGTYTWVGTTTEGCDSTVTLDLTINNSSTSTDVQTACDSLVWNGTTYTMSGTYTWTGTNAVGCDSTVTLDLTINNSATSTDVQAACDSLVWNGTTYTMSGTYTWVGTTTAGCDSTVTLDLTINTPTTSTDVQTACDSLVWNGTTYTTSGTYTWTGTNAAGCDSTVTLDLTVNNATSSTVVETACTEFDWNGTTYTMSGTYTWTGTNAAGCDSVVTLDLTINTVDVSVTNNDPTIQANATGATYQWIDCDNNNDPITGETAQTFTATANGNYAVIVTDVNGCSDTSACTPIVTVSLDDLSPLSEVSVYPNPVRDIINIDLAGLENAQVRLLDMSGKVLCVEDCETTELFMMEMNQAPGAYIIEVQSNEFVKQFKLIKE